MSQKDREEAVYLLLIALVSGLVGVLVGIVFALVVIA